MAMLIVNTELKLVAITINKGNISSPLGFTMFAF